MNPPMDGDCEEESPHLREAEEAKNRSKAQLATTWPEIGGSSLENN